MYVSALNVLLSARTFSAVAPDSDLIQSLQAFRAESYSQRVWPSKSPRGPKKQPVAKQAPVVMRRQKLIPRPKNRS